ncbi:hypothetical protein [Gulosibacter hominis]|uniref:hypothetical protein n=1 Tax=Gulosibacter hominis TaxID=2770504 RepID=UPI00191A3C0F|nr:hypothetical protein [Gulosibacter hominis]
MKTSLWRLATPLAISAVALTGCSLVGGGDDEAKPTISGEATEYQTLDELKAAFVAAGGECDEWEAVDPGEYDAEAGRCGESTVLAVYRSPDQIPEVVSRAQQLATQTHLLVGENWVINTPNPEKFVEQLGGTTVY